MISHVRHIQTRSIPTLLSFADILFKDATLKRCFGVGGKIIDFDYTYLKTLRTLEAPHVPMATLREVLELMCQPAVKDIWLLLDIKVYNNANDIIRLIRETLWDVGGGATFWGRRVVLGCWTLEFIPVSMPRGLFFMDLFLLTGVAL